MIRLLSKLKLGFSTHYHPCKFQFKTEELTNKACVLSYYIELYRKHAHHFARLDPLDLYNETGDMPRPTDLGIRFNDSLDSFSYSSPVVKAVASISELQECLKRVYQQNTAVQFSHITLLEEQDWLYEHYEKSMLNNLEDQVKIKLAKKLVEAEAVDHFLHLKFVTFKRYSGQGAEGTVLALECLFQMASQSDFSHLVFGMPHRGRFNLLVNSLNYQARHLFRKISGKTDTPSELHQIIDDATSHVAQSTDKQYSNKNIKVTLVHNPSHLEAQNPVSMGKTRSKQHIYGKDAVLNVQVHGDAAFCAQGIVYESLLIGKTPNFNVDGTIHIITNNQIGYTTKARDSRGSKYATDVCKAFDIPIIHVNSENCEQIYKAVELAVKYRRKFKKDILIDLICYRKYGHNEVDEPEFTQPKMYQKIRKDFVPATKNYAQKLHTLGLVDADFYELTKKTHFAGLEKQFEESKKMQTISVKEYTSPERKGGARAFTQAWSSLKPSQYGSEKATGVDPARLREYALASTYIPDNFTIHPRIQKYHVEDRLKSIETNKLNWATCEALAMFSLNAEGYNIRMSGQDVERGTFSQRHCVLTDQKNESNFNALEFFSTQQPEKGTVEICNSALSEDAVMSYEYGYSLDHPNNFAIWQAQFGDFYNTAQTVVDVFLTNSENKWMRQSGITLILPHGYDGAGPEHSSCRIERFLQLANSDGNLSSYKFQKHDAHRKPFQISEKVFAENIYEANFSLVVPTKPANLFHVMRRQMKRDFRKPLIMASTKTLFRLQSCVSSFQELGPSSHFEPILPYANCDRVGGCEVILIASGRFVYDVEELIVEKRTDRTCIFAIEELFPFPEELLAEKMANAKKNVQVYWVQAENLNSGGFTFCEPRIQRVLHSLGIEKPLQYVGRRAIAATAVGSSQIHKRENEALKNWLRQVIQ